ncbi:MAG: serine/threonine protein kinase, partial [Planctomycetes bacterium]|nr:serine/threonine protein kinase [Planctomycetota bacterium]
MDTPETEDGRNAPPIPSGACPDPLLGRVLGGDFRLLRLLGRGGMGAVYLGEQLSLKRHVAIKVLPAHATADSDSVQRFQREAHAAGRLEHPNIVQVHAFAQDQGQYFIAMQYVEGESLADRLRRERRLPVRTALRIGRELARALAAAHAQGLVHRDVKPENVFVGKSGGIKLGDFGLARDVSGGGHLSVTGQVLGTPLYMAPEQCRGEAVDGRADLYALGATLYHLLAGRPPHQGKSALDILYKVVHAPVAPLASLVPGSPSGVAALIARLLEKDPAARPASAEATAAALGALLAEGPATSAGAAPRATAAGTA